MSNSSNIEVLFGKIAVSCGFVSEADVQKGIAIQRNREDGRHLGRILMDLEVLDEDQLMTVLAIQRENRFRTEMSSAVREAGATLGELAVAKGYCSQDDIHAAIEEQAKLERYNLFFRLGEVLVSRKSLEAEKVHELLSTQNITIMGCPGCFSRFNVMNYNPDAKIPCPKCNTVLTLPANTKHIKVDGDVSH